LGEDDDMRGEHPHLVAYGGWGEVIPPAFAYDLFSKELWRTAKSYGLVRLGKEPGGTDDDHRPIVLGYVPMLFGNTPWTPQDGATPMISVNNSNIKTSNGDGVALSQPQAKANTPARYTSPQNIEANTGWTISAYLNQPPKGQNLRLHQWRVGVAGQGFLFQIRDGKPEVGFLADTFNLNDLATLHTIWASSTSYSAGLTEDNLKRKLFGDTFTQLSFENSTSKDDWYNNLWTMSFIPEPKGAVHCVLEGLDATSVENPKIVKTRLPGVLWPTGPITYFNGGGAYHFAWGWPWHDTQGGLQHGPFYNSYWVDDLGDCTFARNAFYDDVSTFINYSQIGYVGYNLHFGFQANLSTNNRRKTPWLYGLSARLAPGPRNTSSEVSFDTDNLYKGTGDTQKVAMPILDVELSWDSGSMTKRQAMVKINDVNGWASEAREIPRDRVCDLLINTEPVFNNGIITTVRQNDLAAIYKPGDIVSVLRRFLPLGNTEMHITIADGWEILATTKCKPPPIGDNKPLGTHVRALLLLAGFLESEISGVSPTAGINLPSAALGEDWAERPDEQSSIADALRTLFDSYGYGWRFYQDRFGIWQMVNVIGASQGNFTSTKLPHDVHTEPGRLKVLRPIDLIHDTYNFYNRFCVVGGKDGQLKDEWTIWESVRQSSPTYQAPNWIGRIKEYPELRNTSLRTRDQIEYAKRSLVWNHGRAGRRGQFATNFHLRFNPGDRINVDGGLWEIDSISGASWAKNEAYFGVIEVTGT
jgi:hypothetical protein